jgi:TM2 domain-containing membrane protein YozV
MDALETHLLISRSQQKSEWLAALLGSTFPAIAAFYVRKPLLGLIFLVLDLVFLVLSIVGIGLVGLVLFRFYAAFQAYRGAKHVNETALERLIQARREQNGLEEVS